MCIAQKENVHSRFHTRGLSASTLYLPLSAFSNTNAPFEIKCSRSAACGWENLGHSVTTLLYRRPLCKSRFHQWLLSFLSLLLPARANFVNAAAYSRLRCVYIARAERAIPHFSLEKKNPILTSFTMTERERERDHTKLHNGFLTVFFVLVFFLVRLTHNALNKCTAR